METFQLKMWREAENRSKKKKTRNETIIMIGI